MTVGQVALRPETPLLIKSQKDDSDRRDFFIAAALTGLCVNMANSAGNEGRVAHMAVRIADEVMKARAA